ncbi:MAG: urate hydroxylase PuuD [Elusimicrobia bacterium]|nr:urate hydroxylase PuuD [Elusimicrobiota bacterium]
MDINWLEWSNLIVRWFHVIAGITWIGQTYLFNWMERVLEPPPNPTAKPNISGELWMVHGGGFYLVEKQKWPEIMPRTLHWFKWEAGLTWITGMLLLGIVYWVGAPLLPYGSALSQAQGVGVSLGVLIGGYLAYHLIWDTTLGKSEPVGVLISWALIVLLAYELSHVLSNRAVYLHVGAMFGTIMVSNVWLIIIPNQKKMMAITAAGGPPQPELAKRSARCSRHNTFMSVPLIFTMISNHFPDATFGRGCGWAILGGLVLFGFGAAKIIRDYL